ncbi:hypothetical protein MPF19_03290 [Polaribacter sp. Z014]|uniref:hypothetical protein n=1 Tax=unclassified Polaribacter TaxID=196858 RepID=UPI00193C4534|nr:MULTISPECIES: hypothetical protein [unclassified Polaribacter]MCL7762425.1 hypothetical protein [Polaribacter sp. Z014]QVY64154.1 hypothetical protein JOP69_10235 [Polaribacter sp. Q13]
MKTLFKFSQIFILSILLFSCESEKQDNEGDGNASEEINDSRPSNAITYKEMADMFHQYDVGQKPVLDKYRQEFTNDATEIESISHFYEINQLKQYIAYVERLSKEKNITLTGIRIFSASYPKDYSDERLRGRQTLIFMPTADTKEKKNVAYEPLYSKNGEAIPFTKFLDEYSSDETKNVIRASFLSFIGVKEDLNSSGANRLLVTPPY